MFSPGVKSDTPGKRWKTTVENKMTAPIAMTNSGTASRARAITVKTLSSALPWRSAATAPRTMPSRQPMIPLTATSTAEFNRRGSTSRHTGSLLARLEPSRPTGSPESHPQYCDHQPLIEPQL